MKKTIFSLALVLLIAIAGQAQTKTGTSAKVTDSTIIKAAMKREKDSIEVNRARISLLQINVAIDDIGKDLGGQLTKDQWDLVLAIVNRRFQEQVNKTFQK